MHRPHAQQDIQDPRYAPIPPPPFSARPSSAQPNILHSGDPFLQRRVEPTDPHHNAAQPQHYGVPSQANYINENLAARHEQVRREEYGPLMRDRYERIGHYTSIGPDADLPEPRVFASERNPC
ncbi:MAG: hypothetical protein Q9201_005566 [Fulgogasparrea decipioides]